MGLLGRSARLRLTRSIRLAAASAVLAGSATAVSVVAAADQIALAAPSASTIDIVGPAGSQYFGQNALVLSNGNFVLRDENYDASATRTGVGQVSLYSGTTHQLISMLTGTTSNDHVGENGVFAVGHGNFVVVSSEWDNNGVVDVGAVTWVNGTTGFNGPISEANSLFGSTKNDEFTGSKITVLANGNYVAANRYWANGAVNNAGAVTWGDGDHGVFGPISTTNSIVGTHPNDNVGSGGTSPSVVELANGNYVVSSTHWANGAVAFAGAVTWANGNGTTVGAVSAANSLVGSSTTDSIGTVASPSDVGILPLKNGNFVVASESWTNPVGPVADVGAVTLASGTGSTVGPVTPANSLVGTLANDAIGSYGVVALTGNNNYVVVSPNRDGGGKPNAGAVTWGNGTTGTVGPVGPGNSLVGGTAGDLVGASLGYPVVTPLANGNYVVGSSDWHNTGVASAGAATFQHGDGSGPNGLVTSANSLVGTTANDQVGQQITASTNGNYVLGSPEWNAPAAAAGGAITFGDGTNGTAGNVSVTNSFYGIHPNDHIGSLLMPLHNGNFVATSTDWDNGSAVDAGAATWISGAAPSAGAIDASNSLVGTQSGDVVGSQAVTLANGDYIVNSPGWNGNVVAGLGAVTYANGLTGRTGTIDATNSLVGTATADHIGAAGVSELTPGMFLVASPFWNNGGVAQAGAVTHLTGAAGLIGNVTATNSLVGTRANDQVGYSVSGPSIVPVGANGRYVVVSSFWDNGSLVDAGAVTLAGRRGITGPIDTRTSFLGLGPTDIASILPTPIADGSVLIRRPGRKTVTILLDAGAEFAGAANVSATAAPGAASAVVNYTPPTAVDILGTSVPVACVPPTGSTFPVGSTTVTCTATTVDGIVSTTSFTVTVAAGTGGPGGAPDYIPLAPARLADTRPTHTTVDGLFAGDGQVAGGTTLQLPVAGRGGVPANAVAATLNVTVTEASAAGFVTVFPCGSDQPTASNLNFDVGATVPNAVVTKIGTGGNVCIFASQTVHLVVDVNGAFPPSTTYVAINPARVLDTRAGHQTLDGAQQAGGKIPAGTVTVLQITGRAGVPADASAVVLNVTVTEPDAGGYATVYPCGGEPPLASNLNFTAGLTIPNLAISKIGVNGTVCIFNQSATQLVADIGGYFPAATTYAALNPARLLDTRSGFTTVDGVSAGAGVQPVGTVTVVHVAGRGNVPANAKTAVLNVTVTDPAAAGYITVYPCGIDAPLASNVNFVAGQIIPNSVLAKIGTNGDVCILNSQPTNLIADVTGYFP